MRDSEVEALQALDKHNLHPIHEPLGEDHHTDMPFTQADEEIAELAFYLGGLFIDKENFVSPDTMCRETYWYREMTSIDIWKRVARALRIHGLKIVDVD